MSLEATNTHSVGSLASSLSTATIKEGKDAEASTSNKEKTQGKPKFQLSNETLMLLDVPKPGPSKDDPRSKYPVESKAIYLRLKDLYRKKLTLAQNIVRTQSNITNNVTPKLCEFRVPTPPRINVEPFNQYWLTITREAKSKLTDVLLEALQKMFTDVINTINQNLDELKKILSEEQMIEVTNSLKEGYTKAATRNISQKPTKDGEESPNNKRKNTAPKEKRPFKKARRQNNRKQ